MDPEVIDHYQKACTNFRTALNLTEPDSLMGILYGSVATRVSVPSQLVNTFRAMIARMKKQSDIRLGSTVDKGDSSKLLTGVKAFLRSKGRIPTPVPLNKRNQLSVDGREPDGAGTKESGTKGAYLVTTAIMQLKAKKDQEIEALVQNFKEHYSSIATTENALPRDVEDAKKMLGYAACWEEEAEKVAALSGEGSGFLQQGSGIDVISGYFWLFRMGCRTYQVFEELNGLLVGISQNPMGKAKTGKILD